MWGRVRDGNDSPLEDSRMSRRGMARGQNSIKTGLQMGKQSHHNIKKNGSQTVKEGGITEKARS